MHRRPFILGLSVAMAATLALVIATGEQQPWVVVDDNTGGDMPFPTAPGGHPGEVAEEG